MDGILTGRRRRPLWGWLTMLSLIALVTSSFLAHRARTEAIREATSEAETIAQTQLATLLEPSDLLGPVTEERGAELSQAIRTRITVPTSIEGVRIYSAFGRILYAEDPEFVGTRPSYLRDLTFEVANGEAQTWIRGGVLQTYVPIWLSPGGTVVVAEVSQAVGSVTGPATARWTWAAIGLAILLAGAIALIVITSLDRTPAPAMAHGRRLGGARAMTPNPYVEHGAHAVERGPVADPRVTAAERRASELQRQLDEARNRIALLEREHPGRAVEAETAELRTQLARATEQLHLAELDAKAVRERLAARQHELDEARALSSVPRTDPGEIEGLRERLGAAEGRARELEIQLEQAQADLESANTQLGMTRLSEVLREIQHEGQEHGEPRAAIGGSPGSGRTVG